MQLPTNKRIPVIISCTFVKHSQDGVMAKVQLSCIMLKMQYMKWN